MAKEPKLTPEEEAWFAKSDERFHEHFQRLMQMRADLEARNQAQLEAERRAEERGARRRRLLLLWLPSRLRG